ncbi:MAG: DUF2851 family protein [Dehalococcoidia bacterium]|nr:DUF2851 family protein [Dehalococcoidia bacterium]
MSLLAAAASGEAALAARWGSGLAGALRLEDGRTLRVIFPGVPGGASGPDFRDAILDAGGDVLRGHVELHLRASGWRAHGHAGDPAYAGVVLHVVAENDTGALSTLHASGRAIPVLVLREPGAHAFPPPFTPPCALAAARGQDPAPALHRLGERRLRSKAARVAPLVAASGPGQAVYTLALETLAGSANRAAFASLARSLPLAALLERAAGTSAPRPLAITAELKGAAARLSLRRAGLRPMAQPARRLEAAGTLVAALWPGVIAGFPPALIPAALLPALRQPGIGRAAAIELAVNAVLPVALASGAWSEEDIAAAFAALPGPGTYGKLRRLEGWLGAGAAPKPFATARALQGGLLLHADYCTRGRCGQCPLSPAR